MLKLFAALAAVNLWLSYGAFADPKVETEQSEETFDHLSDDQKKQEIKSGLTEQLRLLATLEPHAEPHEIPNLEVLVRVTETLLKSIETLGSSHSLTSEAFLRYFITYSFSTPYFKDFDAELTLPAVKRLPAIADRIARIVGYGRSTFSHVTQYVFTQMDILIRQAQEKEVSEGLKEKLKRLRRPISDLMSESMEFGDNLGIFLKARPICAELNTLYEEFNEIDSSDKAFVVFLEIRILNEWYQRKLLTATEEETKK